MLKLGFSFEPPSATRPSGALVRGLAQFKAGFLDRERVQKALTKAQLNKLMQIGALVRTIAQRSMRRRKKPSPPGQPPSSHPESGGMLREWIRFAWLVEGKSLVVGPESLNRGKSAVPALHEHGGTKRNERRKDYRIGQAGPVRMQKSKPRTKHARKFTDSRGKPWVIFARLRTPKAIANAEEIDAQLYGPRQLRYPPRPYMKPAFNEARKRYAQLFADSVH